MIDGECTVVSRYKLKFASHCVVEVRTHFYFYFFTNAAERSLLLLRWNQGLD